MKVNLLSRVRLLATPWTAAYQAPPSMGVSRQEYWSGVPLLSPIYFIKIFILTCSEFKINIYFKYSSILIFKFIKLGIYDPYKHSHL